MTIYEINAKMADLFSRLEPDENGVIDDSCLKELDQLAEVKAVKLENSCRYYLNLKAEAEALRAEEKRLADRRKVLENKQKSMLKYLEYATDGETTDCGVATVKYRTSKSLSVTDARGVAYWLRCNGHPDLVTDQEPRISANEVKKLLSGGADIPGCAIEEKRSCSVG